MEKYVAQVPLGRRRHSAFIIFNIKQFAAGIFSTQTARNVGRHSDRRLVDRQTPVALDQRWPDGGILFLVGLEIKRELIEGIGNLLVLAAIGGMISPAGIYGALNNGDTHALKGPSPPLLISHALYCVSDQEERSSPCVVSLFWSLRFPSLRTGSCRPKVTLPGSCSYVGDPKVPSARLNNETGI
jgi:hypothetical protein